MAPLDAGYVNSSLCLVDPFGDRVGPHPENFESLGFYLRAVREHRGWTLTDLAQATRIRRAYLDAIEDGDMSILPSRPFALGYVRAYARSLGLDGELAAQRFKLEFPHGHEPLRAPAGVRHQIEKGSPVAALVVGGLIVAVLIWNFVQHALSASEQAANHKGAVQVQSEAPPPPTRAGAFIVAPPSAAPAESTTPPPYVTPGLEAVIGPMTAAAAAEARPTDELPLGVPFEARGQIFNQAGNAPAVALQARKSAMIVIRRADGLVFFARQLKAGETLVAPTGRGLSAEVNDPDSFYTILNNSLVGKLTALHQPLDAIQPPPPPPGAEPVVQAPSDAPTPSPAH